MCISLQISGGNGTSWVSLDNTQVKLQYEDNIIKILYRIEIDKGWKRWER